MTIIPSITLGMEHAEQNGLDSQKLVQAFQCIDRAIEEGTIPGGAAVVGGRGGWMVSYAAGSAAVSGEPALPVHPETTVYDCASLTKVVVTLPLVLQLVEQGRLGLNDAVASYLPEYATEGKAAVTVRQLLTHTAGLKPYVNLHAHGWPREEVLAQALAQPLAHAPGTQVVYSDLGYIALGRLAERLHGLPLAEAARRHVLEPLGMAASGYNPLSATNVAPTEWDPAAQAFRHGAVHDENAAAMGGVSGHAGLFATASDIARYAAMWLHEGALPPALAVAAPAPAPIVSSAAPPPGQALGSNALPSAMAVAAPAPAPTVSPSAPAASSPVSTAQPARILAPATVRAAIRSHTGALTPGHRGLGWVLQGDPFDASGDLLSPESYGHTGFTGTSLYVDPNYGLFIVILTNRVHYGREKSVGPLRARLHSAVAGSIARL